MIFLAQKIKLRTAGLSLTLRRMHFASRDSFISAELSGCFYLEEVSSRPPRQLNPTVKLLHN